MSLDPSVLLQAKGIDIPDPVQAMGRSISLADMMMKLQQAQAVNAYWSQALGQPQGQSQGQQPPQGGDPSQSGMPQPGLGNGGGQSPFGVNMQALQQNPMAASAVLPSVIGMAQKQAETGKAIADTGKANQEVTDARLKTFGNYANAAAEAPTPQNIQGALRQFQFTNLSSDTFGPMPTDLSDTQGWQTYLKGVASAVQTPEQRANIQKTGIMTPIEAAQGVQNLGLNPQKVAISQQEANTGSANAQLNMQKFASGEPFAVAGPNGDQWYVKQPGTDAQGKPTFNIVPAQAPGAQPQPGGASVNLQPASNGGSPVTPAALAWMQKDMAGGAPPATPIPTNAQGAPTLGIGPGQKELLTTDAKTVGQLNSQIPGAMQGLNTLYAIRNQISSGQGIYQGPIEGREFFKNIAGVLSQLPGASDEMKAKVNATQAFESDTGQLAFDMMTSLKGSSPRAMGALNAIKVIKPNTMMTPQAMQQVMDTIESRYNDQLTYAQRATAAVQGGGSLADVPYPKQGAGGGFTKGQQLQSLPNPSAMPGGTISVDGQMLKSNGSNWVPQ